MVQMWRDGVDTTSEVHIVRKVNTLAISELLGYVQQEQETVSQPVLLLIMLVLLNEL